MASFLLGVGVNASANTGNWPARPIRIVVAGSVGAGGDIFARLIAAPLQKVLKQPVVVDTKPGANGLIACDTVAKAAGDGYTSLSNEVTDLIANNISVGFTDIASPIPHMRNGKLVALGTTGSRRWPATQNVPSLTEQGYKFDADGWYGVFAPAGTPREIIDRLNAEINKLQKTDEVRQKIEGQNMIVPPARSAKQFAASIKKDAAIWQGLAKTTDLKDK